jgi:hypothetical protein
MEGFIAICNSEAQPSVSAHLVGQSPGRTILTSVDSYQEIDCAGALNSFEYLIDSWSKRL